jgi:two-component system, LytTR family, response regulator
LLQPDLVFLDIQIGADNGLDMLDGFPERKFQVVVCTGYDNYAIKAIKQKALDYILKPIDPDELASAIKKATLAKIQAEPKRLILTATDGADHLVAPAQICRIESDGAYTTLHLNNDRRFTQARSLREFEEELPYFFVRVHQSHLININEIAQFHANDMMVQMNNGDHLPVARRRKAELMEVIGR